MKRMILLLICICLAASVCACTSKEVPADETTALAAPSPLETASAHTADNELIEAMREKIASTQEKDTQLQESVHQQATQADMNGIAYERNALWQMLHTQLWEALEQTLDAQTMEDLMAEHLNWSADKRIHLNLLAAELGGGSLTGTVLDGENAKMTQERVMVLFSYLEGSASPVPRASGLCLAPDAIAADIADAYFCADAQTIQTYLSDSYFGVIETGKRDPKPAYTIKNLDNIVQSMAQYGRISPSIEFRESPDSDYYCYLSLTLIWEDNRWVISSYGLEG